ncbi:hypothetical protein KSP40_PGU007374 [Platanthera guangdongensis]|uniref:Uncharacterized protein n=1 Tax=Platanthera guangdongensis TaxID=2320717 RepID=A0ABR2MSK1_9ASPA
MSRRALDVDAEYTEAFHSRSFLDMWAQAHQGPTEPTSFPVLPDILLDPTQASLLRSAAAVGSGAAILEYVEATLQSFSACTDLLDAIDRTRTLHHAAQNLLFRLDAGGRGGASTSSAELAGQIELGNPLSPRNLSRFHRAHALFQPLLARLSREQRRLQRRARALRAAATAAITLVAAVAVSAVVIATHAAASLLGAAASPALVAGGMRRGRRWVSVGWTERAGRRADAAARGAYYSVEGYGDGEQMVSEAGARRGGARRDEVRLVLGSVGLAG